MSSSNLGKRNNQVLYEGVHSIPNEETPLLYNRSMVFVQPSIVDEGGHTEGLPIVLLEAMACGTPCIASSVGGIPDAIIDGFNGFLVEQKNVDELSDRITQLIQDEDLRKTIGRNARQHIEENFTWERSVNQTIAFLKEVIDNA